MKKACLLDAIANGRPIEREQPPLPYGSPGVGVCVEVTRLVPPSCCTADEGEEEEGGERRQGRPRAASGDGDMLRGAQLLQPAGQSSAGSSGRLLPQVNRRGGDTGAPGKGAENAPVSVSSSSHLFSRWAEERPGTLSRPTAPLAGAAPAPAGRPPPPPPFLQQGLALLALLCTYPQLLGRRTRPASHGQRGWPLFSQTLSLKCGGEGGDEARLKLASGSELSFLPPPPHFHLPGTYFVVAPRG